VANAIVRADTKQEEQQVTGKPLQLPVDERAQAVLDKFPQLSSTEARVLGEMLRTGQPSKVISPSLGISPSTMESHFARLIPKLGVSSRLQAVILAASSGLPCLGTPVTTVRKHEIAYRLLVQLCQHEGLPLNTKIKTMFDEAPETLGISKEEMVDFVALLSHDVYAGSGTTEPL
jgi:DNA-binding CsgD family transcriptional regulator